MGNRSGSHTTDFEDTNLQGSPSAETVQGQGASRPSTSNIQMASGSDCDPVIALEGLLLSDSEGSGAEVEHGARANAGSGRTGGGPAADRATRHNSMSPARRSLSPGDQSTVAPASPPEDELRPAAAVLSMEIRPPALDLDWSNNNPNSIATAADAIDAGDSRQMRRDSLDTDPNSSRGAHVDVSIFKYQPGVAAPVENLQYYRINQKGAALTGGMHSEGHDGSVAIAAGHVDIAAEYERRKGQAVERYLIRDHRAKQLLVVPSEDKFVAVAAPEAFSRHSGTCMILGGQGAYNAGSSKSYELKLGNFLRIGSVGVVVSEIHTGPEGELKCLSWEELVCLKGDIATVQQDMVALEALTAQEEEARENARSGNSTPRVQGKMCYMCFDTEDTTENPLVAPCECKGDTRYVHLNCLQKWHTAIAENRVCVVLNNKGVRLCTVCRSPYRAMVRLVNGDSISLFQSPLPPPYICFMVVTKHQNNEDLFSTKYQLSFSSVMNRTGGASSRSLVVGRSRQCDMVLDYRTVSTKHATIRFQNGRFYFNDMTSSNGSYLYLREPLQLPYGETVYLKWGSNVVSLKAKRSIRHRLTTLVGRRASATATAQQRTAPDFSMLEALCEMGQSPRAASRMAPESQQEDAAVAQADRGSDSAANMP